MRSLLLTLLFFCAFGVKASHIVGGDIYYDYLGNNNYKFYITVYRDCNSTGAEFDDPLFLSVYLQNGTVPIQNISVPFPGSTLLPVVFNNPCVVPPNNICVQRAIYVITVNLPPTPGGYTVTYQRCCRGPNITNLVNPDNTGLTLTAKVPGSETNATVNSSPRFTNYPPLLLCNNDDLIFDHSATDPDGDQLVYSLVTPFSGGTSANPLPNPSPPPPYFPVNWSAGFTALNPLGPGATIAIDPVTGLLTASPQMLGLFVVGIRVQEFRNGVLIGQTIRDFLFKVFNCNITLQAILPTQDQLPTNTICNGLTVPFVNNSFGGTNYLWDFGVSGITTDISTSFQPTYTFPSAGTYEVMLVANPGWPCTDTAFMTIVLSDALNVSFSSNDSLCINGNSFTFIGQSNGVAGTVYNWDFGPNASISSANTLTVSDVNFSVSGYVPVTLNGSFSICSGSYTDSVYIFPAPEPQIVLPSGYECDGLSVSFGNASLNTTDYHWDFGVNATLSDTSNLTTPTFTFPSGGTYTITLIGSSAGDCIDTITESITVHELLSVAFTSEDSLCITGNSFDFIGAMTGPNFTTFNWDFGPNASLSSSSDLVVNGVSFNTPGTHLVTLTGSFNNCVESTSTTIFLYNEPTIDFTVEEGPHCAPASVQFTDLSTADSPIYYLWEFGDGQVSTVQNPNHAYPNSGVYPIQLTIYTTIGCIDTLQLQADSLLRIHPSPISAFSVDPKMTDICSPGITFHDLSFGANSIFYWLDDGNSFSHEPTHTHLYRTSGMHRPMQIATNGFGCSDTSYQELFIEPFSLFIPNAFTPDGDEFNNTFFAKYALNIVEWELRIYNRWGQLVFESFDPNAIWDGTFGGEIVADGMYTYDIRYIACDALNAWQTLTGHLTLLR